MSKAILVVDVQNDFCEGGALAVEGGNQVARDVSSLLAQDAYDYVIASRDWHEALPSLNGGHFAAPGTDPDFIDSWPVHCVQNTFGAEYNKELVLPERTIHVVKGMGRPDYSAFQGEEFNTGLLLTNLLREKNVVELDVVGIAGNYCVKESALDGVRDKFNVVVIKDLVASIPNGTIDTSYEQMRETGVQLR